MKTHISLNVSNIEESIEFYKKMLGTEPLKLNPVTQNLILQIRR